MPSTESDKRALELTLPYESILCFSLGEQYFGLPLRAVKETIAKRPLTRVPFCPPAIAGLLNLRGEVVVVLDLAALLSVRCSSKGPSQRIVLLRSENNTPLCGLLVDELHPSRKLSEKEIRPHKSLAEPLSHVVSGVTRIPTTEGEQVLLCLSPERLLQLESLRPFCRAPQP